MPQISEPDTQAAVQKNDGRKKEPKQRKTVKKASLAASSSVQQLPHSSSSTPSSVLEGIILFLPVHADITPGSTGSPASSDSSTADTEPMASRRVAPKPKRVRRAPPRKLDPEEVAKLNPTLARDLQSVQDLIKKAAPKLTARTDFDATERRSGNRIQAVPLSAEEIDDNASQPQF